MINKPLDPRIQKLVDDLAADMAPSIKEIESSIPTTQNHYGRYGALLSTVSGGKRNIAQVLVLALIQAGANEQGVQDAFKCFC